MIKIIYLFASAAIILLLVVVAILVFFNPGEKLLKPFLSIFLVSLSSAVITSFFVLQEETIKETFLTSVITREKENIPYHEFYEGTDPVLERQDEMGFLHGHLSKYPQFKPLDSNSKLLDIYREAIQYQILILLTKLSGEPGRINSSNGNVKLFLKTPSLPKDVYYPKGEDFKDELEKNSLYYYHNMPALKDAIFSLPPNTTIKVKNDLSEKEEGRKQHRIIISKPRFFEIEIIVENYFRSMKGSTLDGVPLQIEDKAGLYTNVFVVRCKSRFDKLTSLNPKTNEYKMWVKYLFKEVIVRFCDSTQENL